ncbi:MAG: tripartite tricarboxylate transporter substrate-binding protein, partial [Betaproteobacteria bacterium]
AGTSIHLAAELLNQITHIHLVHIPYRGSAPAAIALASNEIQLLFDNSMTAIGHVRAGRVKALAIGAKIRLPAINDVPTFIESGLPGFEVSISHGVWMLKTVSPVILKTINQAINLSVQDKDYKNSMNEFGVS